MLRRVVVSGVVAFALACGGDDEPATEISEPDSTQVSPTTTADGEAPANDTAPEPDVRTIEIAIEGGQVVGGARLETVDLGERVRLVITSDTDDSVHVHTYDLEADVGPGEPTTIEFEATIPGRHEVELHDAGRTVLTLEVR